MHESSTPQHTPSWLSHGTSHGETKSLIRNFSTEAHYDVFAVGNDSLLPPVSTTVR